MKSVTHRVTSILLYLRFDSQPHLRRRYVTLLMSTCVLCVYNKKGALTLPLHYQILIIKSPSLIQLKNEIVLTFVV